MSEKYGCVMLAGGSGKRMGGVNKAELEYERQTFAERISRELGSLGMKCYMSSAVYEQELPEGWELVKDSAVRSDGGYTGPAGGVCSCLRRAVQEGLEGLFFAPCDAPLYSTEITRGLQKILEEEPEAYDALGWRTGDGKLQTTFGWYSAGCLPAFEEDINNGKYKLKASLEKVNCRIIDAADAGIRDEWFININSEDEYRRLIEKAGKDK